MPPDAIGPRPSGLSPRSLARAGLATLLSSQLLACSTFVADLPAPIGLPTATPERPAAPPAFPAVHDVPPPREEKPLSEEDRKKLEADLAAARDRQARPDTADRAARQPARPPSTTRIRRD